MLLSHRSATAQDFMQALGALRPFYAGLDDRSLEHAWTGLLKRESVWSLVVEDVEAGNRPVSLSLSTFVSDRLADMIGAGQCPFLGGTVASRFLAKGDEPLSLERMRAAHHGEGLNLVVLHTVGLDVPLGEASTGIVAEHRAGVSGQAMRGYRLKRCLREVYSAQALASFMAGGWRLRTDYERHFGSPSQAPSLERPFLLGLTRAEAESRDFGGARMSAMFHVHPSRLNLRRVHRELLLPALEGLTDVELSQRLSLSPSAVKKRWASIYEHIDGKIPGLTVVVSRTDSTRGHERRRHVLNYLREHPEEFRPLSD